MFAGSQSPVLSSFATDQERELFERVGKGKVREFLVINVSFVSYDIENINL